MGHNLFAALVLCFIVAGSEAGIVGYRDSRQIGSVPLPDPVAVIENGVKNNIIHSLSLIGSNTAILGANQTFASAILIRTLVREGFNLGSVAAYLPKLIFLDGPNQFIETLRLVRSNRVNPFPNDVNGAIDNMITLANSVRDSGITTNLYPVAEFFPNVFRGVERFVQQFMYNAFSWVGPLPVGSKLDDTINQAAIRVESTTIQQV